MKPLILSPTSDSSSPPQSPWSALRESSASSPTAAFFPRAAPFSESARAAS
eukprot:CAMPEP_0184727974 /NCGR_PEP_ID=MMETSP0314-20130426/38193_1 /TAXON_ID=38298 /ORGANISM="Rhodella maculata, Strain CCMP 736" /LENGTH=50 /DNA_ID=CAMNT_0027193709 /DNA_START=39 /DNA_END=191 /DNA_ORIENTATION=+